MNKKQVQQRVLQDGKPLSLKKFDWDEKTKTFSSVEHNLFLDFKGISDCTFKTGFDCIFKSGTSCTFNTGSNCVFLDTNFNCKFNTGSNCIFYTASNSEFKVGSNCVIIRIDNFEVIQPKVKEEIKICPYGVKGYISKRENENAFYIKIDGKRVEAIIADDILSTIIKKRDNIYHVINYGDKNVSYIITDGENYSHGKTLKQAKENLIYKMSNRDTSKYKNMTLDTKLNKKEAVKAYRTITGACELGTKYFCENNKVPKKMTVKEAIKITTGQYGADKFKRFFIKDGE